MLSLQNPEQVYNFWTSKKDKDKKKKIHYTPFGWKKSPFYPPPLKLIGN